MNGEFNMILITAAWRYSFPASSWNRHLLVSTQFNMRWRAENNPMYWKLRVSLCVVWAVCRQKKISATFKSYFLLGLFLYYCKGIWLSFAVFTTKIFNDILMRWCGNCWGTGWSLIPSIHWAPFYCLLKCGTTPGSCIRVGDGNRTL